MDFQEHTMMLSDFTRSVVPLRSIRASVAAVALGLALTANAAEPKDPADLFRMGTTWSDTGISRVIAMHYPTGKFNGNSELRVSYEGANYVVALARDERGWFKVTNVNRAAGAAAASPFPVGRAGNSPPAEVWSPVDLTKFSLGQDPEAQKAFKQNAAFLATCSNSFDRQVCSTSMVERALLRLPIGHLESAWGEGRESRVDGEHVVTYRKLGRTIILRVSMPTITSVSQY